MNIYNGERLPLENEKAKVKKSKNLIIGIIAAVAIIAIGIVAWVLYSSSMSYVAKVDNLKITKQEYLVFSKFNMSQFLTSINSTDVDKYDWKTKINGNTDTAKDQVKKSTLDNTQEIKIQLVKAKEAGITLDAADLKKIDEVITQRITESGSKAAAEKSIMDAYGVSLSDYKEVYKDLVITQKYISAERAKVKVSDDEIKKEYNDNKADYDKVTVTHILISTVDANGAPVSAGKKAEAKKKADDILVKVKAGEDVKALAEKYSEDPGVKDNKGEYTFGKGQMVPEFEEWAFKSHTAGDADIVETSYGYHVIKFQKREETPFDTVKDGIKNALIGSKFNDEFPKRMDAWKKEPQFEIKKNERAIAKIDKSIYGV